MPRRELSKHEAHIGAKLRKVTSSSVFKFLHYRSDKVYSRYFTLLITVCKNNFVLVSLRHNLNACYKNDTKFLHRNIFVNDFIIIIARDFE